MAKILLVEDNEMIRDLITRRLKRRGFEVVIATDGAEGVEKARSERPHLVIMDMGLPVLDGYEATRVLKSADDTRSLPVIGLSAHAMSGDSQKAVEAGCDDYDTKPVEWDRLLQKITTLLERAEAGAVAAEAEASPAGREPDAGAAEDERRHLLVVDDSALNRDVLGRRLAALGHTLEVAETGGAALEMLARGRFDAVLLDVGLPDQPGEEVLRKIRTSEALADLPVLMLCTLDAVEQAESCLAEGADDVIPQPFRSLPLQTRLANAIEKRRLGRLERQARTQLEDERKRADHLLRVLLPAPLVDELKVTRRIVPRRAADAALLVCEVIGLGSACDAASDPVSVLTPLQEVIAAFEDAALRHGVEKVRSAGDHLVAAAGVFSQGGDPVLAAVRTALELRDAPARHRAGWAVRFGVHCGPVVAAVVGRRRYQVDLWGATVEVATAVSRCAGDNTLLLSEAAWRRVADQAHGVAGPAPAGLGQLYQLNGLR